MAASDRTPKGRPFPIGAEGVALIKGVQDRTGLTQAQVIDMALRLADKATSGMRQETPDERVARIIGDHTAQLDELAS